MRAGGEAKAGVEDRGSDASQRNPAQSARAERGCVRRVGQNIDQPRRGEEADGINEGGGSWQPIQMREMTRAENGNDSE